MKIKDLKEKLSLLDDECEVYIADYEDFGDPYNNGIVEWDIVKINISMSNNKNFISLTHRRDDND